MKDAQYWIATLGLTKHPEGGYYKEIYRSKETIHTRDGRKRDLTTSIYFLLPSDEISHFHRLKSDELWYFHSGSSLTVHIIDEKGALTSKKLGLDLEKEELPQLIIPAGNIFGATVDDPGTYALVSCMVSPGFDFGDFELLKSWQLLKMHPQHNDIIEKMSIL